jgi:site-specific DNA-methyltransferase (adenine-specific)
MPTNNTPIPQFVQTAVTGSNGLFITNECNMTLMSRYPDNYFDLAIVDPPYGIGADVAQNANKGKNGYKLYETTNWDNEKPNLEYWQELYRVSKNQIVFGGNYFVENLKPSMGWFVWDKVQRLTMSDCELVYTSFDIATRVFKYARGKNQGFMNTGRFHPTSKPTDIYKFCLDKYAKNGDKILDTHLGSGSIAIACHDYKFELTACELDTEYYNKAIERINNHVAQQKLF